MRKRQGTVRISRQMEKLSTRRSILGTGNKSNERARSDWRIPSKTSRCTTMSPNSKKTGRRHSTKGAEEIIRVAGWEVWTERLRTVGKSMGKMEGKGFRYGMGWRRRRRVCEDTNLKEGVMLRVIITSLFFLILSVTDGLSLCKRPAGRLMGNTW